MALTIEANYSKKVGLPGYSSHQFSLSLKAEITDLNQVPAEAARLYRLLQDGVDTSSKEVGWLPEPKPANGNGHTNGHSNGHTNGHSNGNSHPRNGNGNGAQQPNGNHEQWNCTVKQQELIIKIVDDNRLDKNEVEQLAQDRFGKGVKLLNKLEASGLIEELFGRYPRPRTNGSSHGSANGNGSHRQPQRSNYTIR